MAESAAVNIELHVGQGSKELADEMAKAIMNAHKSADDLNKGKLQDLHKARRDTEVKAEHDNQQKQTEAMKAAWAARSGVLMKVAAASVAAVAAVTAVAAAGIAAGISSAEARLEGMKGLTQQLVGLSPLKNVSLRDAKDAADAYDTTFRHIAISAGQSRDDVLAAFKTVSEGVPSQQTLTAKTPRKTGAQIEDVTANMAQASRMAAGGLAQVTQEYESIKHGQFASNGALVTMVASTSTLKGTAAEVAVQMARMTDVKRIETVEEAMRKMALNVKSMPPTMAELGKTMGEIGELATSSFGAPILEAIGPMLSKVKTFFEENALQIEMTARLVGVYVGNFISGIQDMFKDIGENREVKAWIRDFKTAGAYLKDVFSWIYDNSGGFTSALKWIAEKLSYAIRMGTEAMATIAKFTGQSIVSAAKGGGPDTSTEQGKLKATQAVYDGILARAEQIASGRGAPASAGELGKLRESMKGIHEIIGGEETITAGMAKLDEAQSKFDSFTEVLSHGFDTDISEQHAQAIVAAYQSAKEAGNTAHVKMVQDALAGNANLQAAFIKLGGDIKGGLRNLAAEVGDTEFLKNINDAAKRAVLPGGKSVAPIMQFNGNTFNIKQDFRDQDPDRVMLVFKRDITESARARLQSNRAMPLGA